MDSGDTRDNGEGVGMRRVGIVPSAVSIGLLTTDVPAARDKEKGFVDLSEC